MKRVEAFLAIGWLMLSTAIGEPLMLKLIPPENSRIPRYGKFEARIQTDAAYENPFDPREMDLEAEFHTPQGTLHRMPAFYDEEEGQPVWKVRYAPMELGCYRYRVILQGQTSEEETFECVPSASKGFIRRAPDDFRYLQFDSGEPYFAVGHNVCWTDDYASYFRKMAEHGENYTRIWMIHWNVALEWSGGNYPGLGRYHLGHAARLDHILELAERHRIAIMLCLESFNNLRIRQPYPAYHGNPYARENGGMLDRPEQFFTDPEARRLFRQRLRYLVARYAYSPAILCWEFWNEVDIIEKYVAGDVLAWHRDMARYLRAIDPMAHLITTSFANTAGDPAIWKLPEIEISQNHQYGSRDMAESIRRWTKRNLEEFHKPHLFGEFGTDAGGPRRERDPNGINLHNGLWAATLSGSAGTAMLWWWDNYIEPNDLYGHFDPLARFVADIDWPRARFEDAQVAIEGYVSPPELKVRDLELPCTVGWGQHPIECYRILRDGTIEGNAKLSQFLYPSHHSMHQTQTFLVDYPTDGTFEVYVNTVSNEGRLQIRLDEKLVLDQILPTGPGEGPWKESRFVETWNVYQNIYDRRYAIPVPAGPHTITVDNQGRDWISLHSYRLTNYQTNERPRLRAFGLQNEKEVLLWIQNEQHTWYRQFMKMPAPPVKPVFLSIAGLRDGRYRVEWWDTYRVGEIAEAEAQAEEGILRLRTPTIVRDVACKIRRSGGDEGR